MPLTRGRIPLVAVVGRTNVGKSTLVNRLLGRREAIEHDTAGVTRDRQSYEIEWNNRSFNLIDTGGWEPKATGLAAKVVDQANYAVEESDLVLLVVDATTGPLEEDLVVSKSLRRRNANVLVVANKVDSASAESELDRLYGLGFGPPIPVSALHGRGSGDLLDEICARIPVRTSLDGKSEDPVRVCIVGKPNAGKSSLFNRLLGADRSIVDETPGTTRDIVDETVEIKGQTYTFVDTAGMRRRAKQAKGPEYYGLARSMRAIDRSETAILVIDSTAGITDQDQRIANRIIESGRSVAVVLNKWDLIEEPDRKRIEDDLEMQLPFLRWAPVVRTSALTKRGVMRVMPAVDQVHSSWGRRVPTASLNGWLRDYVDRIPLGSRGNKPPRIKYITQASVRPPHVVVFASGRLPDHAKRAIENGLRAHFGFEGTPIRISVRINQRER
ncbi:MAG: ribosome biogenesis GTPase Der [Actinomycetota bacterium]